jgi:hypothetical protein
MSEMGHIENGVSFFFHFMLYEEEAQNVSERRECILNQYFQYLYLKLLEILIIIFTSTYHKQ